MKHKVLVIGGAGFIGQAVCNQLAQENYSFAALDLPSANFGETINTIKQDILKLSDSEIKQLLVNFTTIIYCLGPDDRAEIDKNQDVYQFFADNLVAPTIRITKIAAQAKVQKIIILGSYFSHFDNLTAGVLSNHHPYIKARTDQWKQINQINNIDKVLIQIPYVFGTVKGKDCLWKKILIDNFDDSNRIIYGRGGTTVISIEKLSKIIVKSITAAKNGDALPVGETNLSFRQIFEPILQATDTNKRLIQPPNWLLNILFKLQAIKNNHFGLNYHYLNQDILSQNFFIPWQETDKLLNLKFDSNIQQTLTKTGQKIKQLIEEENNGKN